jgi:hypothetical protein
MTRKEYQDYEERVAEFFTKEGINCLSSDSRYGEEPFFSWRPCECCESDLGGDRYTASGYCPESGEVYTYDICIDCMYYAKYGILDDQTMMDMEE